MSSYTINDLLNACVKEDIASVQLILTESPHLVNASDGGDVGYSPLLTASNKGFTNIIQLLLSNKADVNQTSKGGRTSLYMASMKGHLDAVCLLIEHGANVNQPGNDGMTPLEAACVIGHFDIINVLLKHKADINHIDSHGQSAIFLASSKGYCNVVEFLLKNGSKLSQQTRKGGFTALFMASQEGHLDVVKTLLQCGAEVDQTDDMGQTPLLQASERGHLECVLILLQNGAKVNKQSSTGLVPLVVAAQKGHCAVIGELINQGASVNQIVAGNESSLTCASMNGHQKAVSILLENEANVNQLFNGAGALHFAAQNGHYKVAKQLIKHKALVNLSSGIGISPLIAASGQNHLKIVRLLLQNGADITHETTEGVTALFAASDNGSVNVISELIRHKANVHHTNRPNSETVLHRASVRGHYDTVKCLLENHADVNAEDDIGITPLFCAISTMKLNIVDLLLHYGAEYNHTSLHGVNIIFIVCMTCDVQRLVKFIEIMGLEDMKQKANECNDLGQNALHSCMQIGERDFKHMFRDIHHALELTDFQGNKSIKKNPNPIPESPETEMVRLQMVMFLLQNKIIKDINALNHRGESATYVACREGFTNIVKCLYEQGADVAQCDYNGMSLLHVAVIHGKTDTVKWLLSIDHIDVNCVDSFGYTPLYRACEQPDEESKEIIKILIENDADLNKCDFDNVSPLSEASSVGNIAAVLQLLYKNVDMGLVSLIDGNGALHKACASGHDAVVTLLISRGIAKDEANAMGNTALHIATSFLQEKCVGVLLNKGGDPNIQNHAGETALHIACKSQIMHQDILVQDRVKRAEGIIANLLLHNADVNATDSTNETPLFALVRHNNTSLLNMLKGSYSTELKNLQGFSGRTLLHMLMMEPHNTDQILWILDRGIDINAVDINGQTCLHLLIVLPEDIIKGQKEKHKSLKLLIERGASLQIQDKFGYSPLVYATRFPATMKILLNSCTSTSCVNSPVQSAIEGIGKIAHYFRCDADIDEIMKPFDLKLKVLDKTLPLCIEPKVNIKKIDLEQGLCTFKNELYANITSPEMLSQYLLQKYGRICDMGETKKILSRIEKFITTFTSQDTFPHLKPVLAGSMKEHTRTMEASEGDYLLEVEDFKPEMFHEPQEVDKSFVRLKLENADGHKDMVTRDGYLNRRVMFNVSYKKVCKQLQCEEMWKNFPDIMRLSNMDVRSDDQSIRHLDILYHDEVHPYLGIDIDLTPAIAFPNWHPPWTRQDAFHQKILKKHGCRAIAKWLPAYHNDPTLFRLSLDGCGIELMKSLPLEYRESYKLAKILMVLCPNVDEYFEEPSDYIPSFHLKTQLFWQFFEEQKKGENNAEPSTEEPNYSKVILITKTMFEQLAVAYQQQWLEDFWISCHNLLLGAKYGSHGWCAASYAKVISWFVKPGIEHLPCLITAADCIPKPKSNNVDIFGAAKKLAELEIPQ